jgi:hypothetical protein
MSRAAERTTCPRALAALLLASASCTTGLGLLQTARTLPRGEYRSSLSAGYDWNFMVDDEARGGVAVGSPGNIILQYAGRFGVREHVDMGVKLFFGLGALVDAKVQMIDRPRLAVSLLGGAGGAFDAFSGAEVLHVPLSLLASYRVAGWLVPYAGAGYGAFWIFNYGSDPQIPPGSWAARRTWHGDGLMMLHAGFAFDITRRTALLLEYGYLRPIVEDPGDHYEFATNHLFLIGVQL